MNKLDTYFKQLEEDIKKLPVDINDINFSNQRLKKLWIIYWTILEINKILGNKNHLENSIEYIRWLTKDKITSITNKQIKDELLYKREEEEEKLKIMINKKWWIEEELSEIMYEIAKDEYTNKTESLNKKIEKFNILKKILLNTAEFLPENRKKEIMKKIEEYQIYLRWTN